MVRNFLGAGFLVLALAPVGFISRADTPRVFAFDGGWSATVDDSKENAGDSITFAKDGKETDCFERGEPGVVAFRDVSEIHFKGSKHPYFVSEWSSGTHGFRISVLDPSLKKNCEVKSFDAPYLIKYEVVGRSLKIEAPEEKPVTWTPPR